MMEGYSLKECRGKHVLVTGGAGFIGSHLVDKLMREGCVVKVLDNLSCGDLKNIEQWLTDPDFKFIKGDLKDKKMVGEALKDVELVFHFAANPEVKVGETQPDIHFNENLVTTFNLLEAMRKSEKAKIIVFASTSTVYGEASKIPTPEDYGPLIPISTYGASKLGCEALICSYAYTFGLKGLILRLANIVGSRAGHGVLVDFIRRLRNNAKKFEILGDGTQKKSYLYVQDCVNAISLTIEAFMKSEKYVDIYNIGSIDQVKVAEIAEIVAEKVGAHGVKFFFNGGVDGGRGWRGDVKEMLLDVSKLMDLGWKPNYSGRKAVERAVDEMLRDMS